MRVSVTLSTIFAIGVVFWFPRSTQASLQLFADIYSECGSTKGCLVSPENCLDKSSCRSLFSHRKLNDSIAEIEIFGQVEASNYMAIGFSIDTKMGDDSVVECVFMNNQVNAYQSFNSPGEKNERLEPLMQFMVLSTSFADGYIYCKVHHPLNYTLNNVRFDLNKEMFVLLAKGSSSLTRIEEHDYVAVSEVKVLISDAAVVPFADGERELKQAHGALMVIAWLISGSIGLLMPRYMKHTWIGRSFYKKDMWFVYHQFLMALTWTFTMIGFIIIFVDVGGWVSEPISENPHPLIGCITTGLAFVQPIMAFLRPPADASNRYIFNWAHRIVGYSAHILALTCIFLAVEMEEAHLPFYTYWVLTAYVVCYVITQLVLTLLARRNAKVMAELKSDAEEPGSSLRQGILYTFVIVSVGLAFSIVGFIASG